MEKKTKTAAKKAEEVVEKVQETVKTEAKKAEKAVKETAKKAETAVKKAVAPKELAGKSGKLKITFTYTNRQFENVNIGGKKEKIYVNWDIPKKK